MALLPGMSFLDQIGGLFIIIILLVNAIAILSEDRFLARIGWANPAQPAFGAGQDVSIKAKLINFVSAVRTLMRIPLIAINILVIIYELLLG